MIVRRECKAKEAMRRWGYELFRCCDEARSVCPAAGREAETRNPSRVVEVATVRTIRVWEQAGSGVQQEYGLHLPSGGNHLKSTR